MILPGSLRSTTLGDVLGQLHRGRVRGELEIIGQDAPYAGTHHSIAFDQGRVADVQTQLPIPRLGEVLMREGSLTPEQHAVFVRTLHACECRLAGELLVAMRLASWSRVAMGLTRQNRLRLDALFSLRRADLRFHPWVRSQHGSCLRAQALTPDDFLYGRPRARETRACDVRPAERQRPLASGAWAEHLRPALALLELTPAADRRDVRQAFRRMAATVHPDLHSDASADERRALHDRFAALSCAYHQLITQGPAEEAA
jgi:hypothetical protein